MSGLPQIQQLRPGASVSEPIPKPDPEELARLLAVRSALCLLIPSPGDDKAEEACLPPLQHLCRVLNRMNGLIDCHEFWWEDAAFWRDQGETSPAG